MTVCAGCGAEATPGQRFCGQCGAPLAHSCGSCGAENPPENRFCGSCGAPLAGGAAAAASGHAAPSGPTIVSERRLVSVLFADLVGFTTLSEHRDPEEVRELLSEYFDRCRALIERYGGTVEKFIGDAVMAVWGTPVAREDDAERAVRAALSLTQAVTLLGEEVGMPELRVRAGVLTGNAAVEVGAEGEGMVLGDTVNTASRLQSIAQPGSVLVDDVTRRSSEAAIEYEDAGEHHVKGRDQPVRAWSALRVVAGVGGARRSVGLEAPFIGRDRELQTIIDAVESSEAQHHARLVAVVGEAGSGKSRLLWEFFKYVDGIEEVRWWHQGRCLSYGEGVSYWALAEMVRARAQINEEDAPGLAKEKLHATVEQFISDERERRLIEPRLAHLLRLEQRPDADRADLFSGWRLFFERLAQDSPVILAFEDLQWADSGLLDFIDYVLEWSADHPIFVLGLGRPELRQRRPGWELLELAPLQPQAIMEILEGLAPGLPSGLSTEIGRRSEGIPLYAVETIRMLKDRGTLTQEGAQYTVTGDVSDLDVPETLQALVASRLDGLSTPERTLLQDVSVLGQSFAASAAAAVSDRPEGEVTELLDGLITKQVLSHDDDPRSPDRGQYVFLQALLRTVAYGTLSRRSRKARHLAAARHLESTWPGEARDIAEVLAAHYLQAIEADPEAVDAGTLRNSARETLTAAGRAAARLALGTEADRYLIQAAELAEDDVERAQLYEEAGQALWRNEELERAEERLRKAIELHRRTGRESGGSAAVTLGTALATSGQQEEGETLVRHFLDHEDPTADRVVRAQALAALGNWLSIRGETDVPEALFAEALQTLELAGAMPELAEAFTRRATHLDVLHRREEAIALARHARDLAEEHEVTAPALTATFIIAAQMIGSDRFTEALPELHRGLGLARERGDRLRERMLQSATVQCLTPLGRWSEAMEILPDLMGHPTVARWAVPYLAEIAAARGDDEWLARCLEMVDKLAASAAIDDRAIAAILQSRAAFNLGAFETVVPAVEAILAAPGVSSETLTEAVRLAGEAAIISGSEKDMERLIAFVSDLPTARATPLLRAMRARLLAEQAHRCGDLDTTRHRERQALDTLESVGARPWLGEALLDLARRHGDREALDRARAIFSDLGAVRALERLDAESGVMA